MAARSKNRYPKIIIKKSKTKIKTMSCDLSSYAALKGSC